MSDWCKALDPSSWGLYKGKLPLRGPSGPLGLCSMDYTWRLIKLNWVGGHTHRQPPLVPLPVTGENARRHRRELCCREPGGEDHLPHRVTEVKQEPGRLF